MSFTCLKSSLYEPVWKYPGYLPKELVFSDFDGDKELLGALQLFPDHTSVVQLFFDL